MAKEKEVVRDGEEAKEREVLRDGEKAKEREVGDRVVIEVSSAV